MDSSILNYARKTGTDFELISPVSGKVISFNETLVQKPELINENPNESGWMAAIELKILTVIRKFLKNLISLIQ